MTPKMPEVLPENVDWDEIADQVLDETASQLAEVIIEAVNEHPDDVEGHVRAGTARIAWVPVTWPDLLRATYQTRQDLSEADADRDRVHDILEEGLRDFALMHRYNPCECGHDPCIAIMPRNLLMERAAAMGRL